MVMNTTGRAGSVVRSVRTLAICLVGLVVVLVSCGGGRSGNGQFGEAQSFVDRAREDLAGRLPASEAEVTVESVEDVEFPDTSLGVPEPGETYAQVVTPGYIIRLSVSGATYEYHAGGNRIVLVPEDRPGSQDELLPTRDAETTVMTGTVELVAEDVWRVDGREIAVTSKTIIEETADAGNVVRIRGLVGPDDVIIADQIDLVE
jgi:hypothetical protein